MSNLPDLDNEVTTAKHLAGRAEFTTVPIDDLHPDPEQPRTVFDEQALQDLADNLEANGMGQPITARVGLDGKMYIVMGERRWRAAKLKGWTDVPCIIRKSAVSEAKTLALQIAENDLREDVNPMDTARALKRYMGLTNITTHQKLAEQLGFSQPWVSEHLALLHLDEADQQRVANKTLGRVEGARIGRQNAGVSRNREPKIPKAHLQARQHTNPYGLGAGSGGRAGTLGPQSSARPEAPSTPMRTRQAETSGAPAGKAPSTPSTPSTSSVPAAKNPPPVAPKKNVVDPDEGPFPAAVWFSEEHPLAARARGRCRIRHQLRKTAPGGVACAECWEAAIRRDEHLNPSQG